MKFKLIALLAGFLGTTITEKLKAEPITPETVQKEEKASSKKTGKRPLLKKLLSHGFCATAAGAAWYLIAPHGNLGQKAVDGVIGKVVTTGIDAIAESELANRWYSLLFEDEEADETDETENANEKTDTKKDEKPKSSPFKKLVTLGLSTTATVGLTYVGYKCAEKLAIGK
ncbi:hypothetical protein IPH25_00830 [bacterium]|nr:MAG: hypothetical protein IPG37_02950 [bacterium]QQR61972.1 MAG: hypothetical protein IPH25_00830 [bacterium]QQR62435.1 MAG: hypothetical protein IPH67_03330 [bacterium]